MVMRESTLWRWSHTRHHSDTIIVGRDPEIAAPPPPPDLNALALGFFNIGVYPVYFEKILRHSFGRMSDEEKIYIPETEFSEIYVKARIAVFIYASAITTSIVTASWLPVLLVGLPNLFGN